MEQFAINSGKRFARVTSQHSMSNIKPDYNVQTNPGDFKANTCLASILYKSIAGRYRPVRVADGPITARYRFVKNASWVCNTVFHSYRI